MYQKRFVELINATFYFHISRGISNGFIKAMKEFGYHKHRHIQDLRRQASETEFLAKIFIDLKVAIFAKRFPP